MATDLQDVMAALRFRARLHLFAWSAFVPVVIALNELALERRPALGLRVNPLVLLLLVFLVPQVLARLSIRGSRVAAAKRLQVSLERVDPLGGSARERNLLVFVMLGGLALGALVAVGVVLVWGGAGASELGQGPPAGEPRGAVEERLRRHAHLDRRVT